MLCFHRSRLRPDLEFLYDLGVDLPDPDKDLEWRAGKTVTWSNIINRGPHVQSAHYVNYLWVMRMYPSRVLLGYTFLPKELGFQYWWCSTEASKRTTNLPVFFLPELLPDILEVLSLWICHFMCILTRWRREVWRESVGAFPVLVFSFLIWCWEIHSGGTATIPALPGEM